MMQSTRELEEPVDRAALLERLGDDLDLLRELVGMFLEDYPRSLAEVEAAVCARNAAALRQSAHFLVGTLSNFSAREAQHAARVLERRGVTGELEGADKDLLTLKQALVRLEAALRDLAGPVLGPA
jgi:HPt (histidine-containing phosphotransfer) domain-containing protein